MTEGDEDRLVGVTLLEPFNQLGNGYDFAVVKVSRIALFIDSCADIDGVVHIAFLSCHIVAAVLETFC